MPIATTIFQHGAFSVSWEDLGVVLLLVFLECILSADNAVVLALLASSLPVEQRNKALKVGMVSAFLFRVVAVVFCLDLLRFETTRKIATVAGGAYLSWLPVKHALEKWRLKGGAATPAKTIEMLFGLSLFWSVVVRIEVTDIVFSVDSILVAVAYSKTVWVILTGGIVGIVAMRFVAGGFLRVIENFPGVVDGAYLIVLVAGVKMLFEFAHLMRWVDFEIPKALSFGLIVAIFVGSLFVRPGAASHETADDPDHDRAPKDREGQEGERP